MVDFLPFFRPQRALLVLGSALTVFFAIFLQNSGAFPLDVVTFFFFSFVLFLFASYRLGWTFLFFVALIPLEIIDIAPSLLGGLALRPYQWVAGILLLALGTRFLLGRLPFRLFRPMWFDALPVVIAFGGFVALFGAPNPGIALKQALVLVSFVAIYFLGRIFWRTLYDVRQTLPFFFVSSSIVFGYALWQNIRFRFGQESFQVMTGRPNATFSEADWLGMFTLVVLGALLALLLRYRFVWHRLRKHTQEIWQLGFLFSALVLSMTVLILTMARSAWLGAVALIGVFVCAVLFEHGWREVHSGAKNLVLPLGTLLSSSLLALACIYLFTLSPFQLLNRIQSTGGLQMITIACNAPVVLPEKITALNELEALQCRHIDLEAIEIEKSAGKFVTEIARPDPNVTIRREIYSILLTLLQNHFLVGIGWGNAQYFLGTDERGSGLNASNVFLEVWLGSGMIGLLSFVVMWSALFFSSFRWFFHVGNTAEEKALALFLFTALVGITVFNLFNSGILLGFFFLFLSLGALVIENQQKLIEPVSE